MARLKFTRDPLHQDVSPDPQGHGRHSKAGTMSPRRVTSIGNRAGGRCDIPTPTKSPVSIRSCTATESMPSSVESGSGPLIRGSSWGTKRRVEFDDDGESEASGSKSLKSKSLKFMAYGPCKVNCKRGLLMRRIRRNNIVIVPKLQGTLLKARTQ